MRWQRQQQQAVLIPHRRGDDGYFMLQVMPPGSDPDAATGTVERSLLPDGEPLELIVVADTSGSMNDDARQNQAQFLTTLLSSLSAQDSFNLVACDVDCHWVFDEPVPADDENIQARCRRWPGASRWVGPTWTGPLARSCSTCPIARRWST